MSRRKKAQAQYQQAHLQFINQTAEACFSNNSTIKTKKFIKAKNVHQKQFVKSIKQNQLTLGIGPAGTGKTLLALFTGIQLINNSDSEIKNLVYIRANVDDPEEKELGALPGGLIEKVAHLTYPILDNLTIFMDRTDVDYLLESGKIEVLPLAMMRGRSFNNCFIIIDEAQNIAPSSMKTILTRCGESSKMILIGDPEQCDKKNKVFSNGLIDLENRVVRKLETYKQLDEECPINLGFIKFDVNDIIRSALTKFAIELYNL